MKKTALLFAAVLGAPFAAAHQGEISAEDWDERRQQTHAEYVVPVPLVHAAAHGDLAEIKRLLENGADPNAVAGTLTYTGLLAASINGHAEAVKMLLDGGADANLADSGAPPLYYAVHWGHLEVVRALLDGGAAPNVRNEYGWGDGWTPLQQALWNGEREMIKALMAAGADPTLPDKTGGTALMNACVQDWLSWSSGDEAELVDIIVNNSDVGRVRYIWACAEGMAHTLTLWIGRIFREEIENEGG